MSEDQVRDPAVVAVARRARSASRLLAVLGGHSRNDGLEAVAARLGADAAGILAANAADVADAYERVLGDAMSGDATLFAREDSVEEAWRIEIERRARNLESGAVQSIPWEVVRERLGRAASG